jgi:hypothetical protein
MRIRTPGGRMLRSRARKVLPEGCLPALLLEPGRDLRRCIPQLALQAVVVAEPLEQHDRVALRRAVAEADDREPAHRLVVVRARQPVQHGAHRVDHARAVAGEQLERDQRRAAAGGALVVEPPGQQLDLLAKPELTDRAVCDRPLAVIRASRRALDLVLPLPAQVGELTLLGLIRESLRLRRCVLELQEAWSPFRERGGGPT